MEVDVAATPLIGGWLVGGSQMEASVTWAKFGVKSLGEYKWNVIQEEVGPTVASIKPQPFEHDGSELSGLGSLPAEPNTSW